MAHYLQSILGGLLLLPSDLPTADAQWPSPQSLMGKILLKGKKISGTTQGVDDDESESETSAKRAQGGGAAGVRPCAEEVAAHRKGRATVRRSRSLLSLLPRRKAQNCREKEIGSDRGDKLPGSTKRPVAYTVSSPCKPRDPRREPRLEPSPRAGPSIPRARTPRLSRALSELTACSRARGAIDVGSHGPPPRWSVTSFAERQASALASERAQELAAFTSAHLARVYPSAHRMSSSNYGPEPFWNAGTQMVSLNYQTEGRPMQLNRAKFAANGNCGYVLKPAEMCTGHFNPLSDDPSRGRARTYLRVRVISGQRLPKPAVSRLPSRDEIIDPYVEVEVVGLPVDSAVRRTRVVDDNGFQPLWDETLVFIIHMPELAMVRFVVWDDDPIGRNFIGQKTIALSSILPGYRHVRLESLSEASIFIYVTIEQIHGKARQASNLMRALGCKSRECVVGDAPRRKHGMRATPRTSLPCIVYPGPQPITP